MIRLFLILVLAVALVAVGCSKKQEEIDALQQDAADGDAAAVMDSLEDTEEPTVPSQPSTTPAVTQEPEPEPEPDYSEMTGFVVQLGSYNNYELATYWVEKFQNRDFPAFLRQVEMDGKTYYRLRVGVFATFEEAKQVGDLLADRYSVSYWIDNNR